jgi:hypothetical protein
MEDAAAADLLERYEARIAALERLVGKQAPELESLKGALKKRTSAKKREHVRRCRPPGLSVAEGRRLAAILRSTYYDPSIAARDDAAGASLVKARLFQASLRFHCRPSALWPERGAPGRAPA